jgi:AraC-like DNA-binding protein
VKAHRRAYGSEIVSFGTYTCRGGSDGVGPEQVARNMVVSVTRRGVFGLHRDGRCAIADGSCAALFNKGDVYRTSHPGRCDDSGFFISFRRDVIVDVLARHDARVAEHPERPFRDSVVPMFPEATLLAGTLFRDCQRLEAGSAEPADARLEFDERALRWLDLLFSAAPVPRHARPARRPPTRAHIELAHDARRLLALHSTERLGLPELAACLGVSPFHLARVFRSVTGTTLHRFLEQHRLAAALDAVNDPSRDLTRIAFESGFSSHSHFTARFHRAYGLTPSEYRRARS